MDEQPKPPLGPVDMLRLSVGVAAKELAAFEPDWEYLAGLLSAMAQVAERERERGVAKSGRAA